MRFIIKARGQNIYKDGRSFKNKSYTKQKISRLNEQYNEEFEIEEVKSETELLRDLVEKQEEIIKLLKESNDFYSEKENWQYDELSTSQWNDCILADDLDENMFGGKKARQIKGQVKELEIK